MYSPNLFRFAKLSAVAILLAYEANGDLTKTRHHKAIRLNFVDDLPKHVDQVDLTKSKNKHHQAIELTHIGNPPVCHHKRSPYSYGNKEQEDQGSAPNQKGECSCSAGKKRQHHHKEESTSSPAPSTDKASSALVEPLPDTPISLSSTSSKMSSSLSKDFMPSLKNGSVESIPDTPKKVDRGSVESLPDISKNTTIPVKASEGSIESLPDTESQSSPPTKEPAVSMPDTESASPLSPATPPSTSPSDSTSKPKPDCEKKKKHAYSSGPDMSSVPANSSTSVALPSPSPDLSGPSPAKDLSSSSPPDLPDSSTAILPTSVSGNTTMSNDSSSNSSPLPGSVPSSPISPINSDDSKKATTPYNYGKTDDSSSSGDQVKQGLDMNSAKPSSGKGLGFGFSLDKSGLRFDDGSPSPSHVDASSGSSGGGTVQNSDQGSVGSTLDATPSLPASGSLPGSTSTNANTIGGSVDKSLSGSSLAATINDDSVGSKSNIDNNLSGSSNLNSTSSIPSSDALSSSQISGIGDGSQSGSTQGLADTGSNLSELGQSKENNVISTSADSVPSEGQIDGSGVENSGTANNVNSLSTNLPQDATDSATDSSTDNVPDAATVTRESSSNATLSAKTLDDKAAAKAAQQKAMADTVDTAVKVGGAVVKALGSMGGGGMGGMGMMSMMPKLPGMIRKREVLTSQSSGSGSGQVPTGSVPSVQQGIPSGGQLIDSGAANNVNSAAPIPKLAANNVNSATTNANLATNSSTLASTNPAVKTPDGPTGSIGSGKNGTITALTNDQMQAAKASQKKAQADTLDAIVSTIGAIAKMF